MSLIKRRRICNKKNNYRTSKILNKEINHFELGNIYAKRDWGYAKEYVEAMWKMLQKKNQMIT